MADRDDAGGDYDDWFDEPEPPQQPRRRGQRRPPGEEHADETWMIPEDEEHPGPGAPRHTLTIGGREITQTQAAIVAVSAIVLLLAVLAAAGVFSSGSKQATPPPPPTVSPPTVTPTAPTTPVTTAGSTVQAPATTLKPGDTGAEVTKLQQALISLGYSPGKADGSYGPGTQKAVTDFQTAQGLAADGIVGPKTLAALQQALAGG